jgi:hypothetical protein
VGVSGKTQTLVIKLTLIITQRLGNQNPPPDTKPQNVSKQLNQKIPQKEKLAV